MHAMCLPLVSQKASGRRKLSAIARSNLALVRSQMGIDIFAAAALALEYASQRYENSLVVAFEFSRFVVASLLALLGAVVHVILSRCCLV